MTTMKKSKKTATICAVVGILVIAASLLMPVTQATAETTKGRTVFFPIKMEEAQVGEVQGQTVGMYETRGLSSDENGESAIVMDYGTFDFMEGFKGYEVLTFEDGSTQWIKYRGTATPAQEGKIMLYEGTFELIKGTGRFEGIKGTGTFTGKNFVTYGVAYIDYTGSYALPTASITVKDLVGVWKQPNYRYYIQFKEDGTYRVASAIENLEPYPRFFGRFQLEGTLLSFITSDESRKGKSLNECPGQTGHYYLKLTEEGQLQLTLHEDPCLGRRLTSTREPFSRVSP